MLDREHILYVIFERCKKFYFVVAGFVFIILLGLVDHFTGYEISFALFYLAPVALVAWYGNAKYGAAASVASAVTWQIANTMAGETFSNPIIPYWNAATRLIFFLVFTFLLVKLKIALEHERTLSRTDYLTGIANKRAFYEIADMELNRARRYEYSLTVAYIDLDNFKQVNDRFGHEAGDAALQTVAETILSHTRRTDVAARLGGDEFALLFPETDYNAARLVIHRIQEALLSNMQKNQWPVTFSIGVLTYVNPTEGIDEMIRVADELMYEVKRNGKNRIEHKIVGVK